MTTTKVRDFCLIGILFDGSDGSASFFSFRFIKDKNGFGDPLAPPTSPPRGLSDLGS